MPDDDDFELRRLVAWELAMLLELGFSIEQAEVLVSMRGFTWHAARYLIKRGCSHELAVEILT